MRGQLEFLFYSLVDPAEVKRGSGGVPFTISWSDAAAALRLGLEVDQGRLPSRCEVFFIHGDNPQGKFSSEKAHRLLGFAPKANVNGLWTAGPA